MAKADTSVKWFHSGMADAPVLSGQTGKLIELLDACLINGFSTRTPDSVVVSGGVATVSISAGNPYEKHAVVAISGASDAALNAEWRIATSAASSFTFLCPGVADGSVTGASVKRVGAGWSKPFSGTNLAAYQSLDPNSTQLYLRVNDADARYARVRGYENMTGISEGTGLFPTIAQLGETLFTWTKSNTESAAARTWALVADGSLLYFLPCWHATYPTLAEGVHFGDFVSYLGSDKYNAVISGQNVAAPGMPNGASAGNGPNLVMSLGSTGGSYHARRSTQTGEAELYSHASVPNEAGQSSTDTIDGALHYFDVFVRDATQIVLRGKLPGLLLAYDRVGVLDNFGISEIGLDVVMRVHVGKNVPSEMRYAGFKIMGPWR